MNKRQIARLVMFQRIHDLLKNNSEIASKNEAFNEVVKAFEAQLNHLKELRSQQDQPVQVVTLSKNDIKGVLRSKLVLTGQFLMMVHSKDGVEGIDGSILSKNIIAKFTEHNLLVYALRISELAKGLSEQLLSVGFTEEDQTSFHQLVEEFETRFKSPRMAVTKRKVVTQKISDTVRSISDHLEIFIDPHIELIREEFSEFHALYQEARTIHEEPVRSFTREEEDQEIEEFSEDQDSEDTNPDQGLDDPEDDFGEMY